MTASKRYGSRVQLNHLQCGDVSYFIVYKVAGKTKYQKIGKKSEGITEKKCVERRNQILSEQRHGIDLSQKSFKYLTFDKLSEAYFSSNEAHNKSNKKYQQMYANHISPSFGEVVIAHLDDSYVYDLQQLKLEEGLSRGTVNMIVKLISRVVGFGVSHGIIYYSPFKKIKLFKINNTRLRYLNQQEVDYLKDAVKDDVLLKLFVALALGTGARANGILSIQKKHVNVDNRSITVKDFKRDNTYLSYLDEVTFDFVLQHIESFGRNGYLVSLDGSATKYQKVYLKLREMFDHFNSDLGKDDRVNRVVIHTLRHTFASHLAIAGVSIQEIQKLMNHKDIKETLKYAKLRPNSGRGFVQELYKGKE